uniref:Uncharacterized protein n=1 Tax=Anguilla anguilla TaxID=7936 RepID=A0A0E9UIS3_ANGAN
MTVSVLCTQTIRTAGCFTEVFQVMQAAQKVQPQSKPSISQLEARLPGNDINQLLMYPC